MNALLKTIDEVKHEMTKLELELEDDTLPHSDQALLQDGWEALEEQLEMLENELRSLEQQEPASRPPTPRPDEVIRLCEGVYVTQEEMDRINGQVDDRATGPVEVGLCGFACDGHCQTCGGGYDPAGEV